MHKAINPTPAETACCAGYREFTFYGESSAIVGEPIDYAIYNKTASNYIHGEVQTISLTAMMITIPSLSLYELGFINTQVLGTTQDSAHVNITFNGDNTVTIETPNLLSTLLGVFTIKIWMNHLILI